MSWLQKNAIALIFGAISILGGLTGMYIVLTTTSAVTVTRLATVERALCLMNQTLKENTQLVSAVHTSISVNNERWLSHEDRLDKLEESKSYAVFHSH